MDLVILLCNSNFVLYNYVLFRLMQAAIDAAFPYMHERKQFGQKIGEFQVSVILLLTVLLEKFIFIILLFSLLFNWYWKRFWVLFLKWPQK